MDCAALEALLAQKGFFHMDMGLGRMRRALAALKLRPYPAVQILGTNGKGSTSAFIAALARAHGLKCGLYTSPHFLWPRERIRLNGQIARKEQWLEAANHLAAAAPDLIPDLTYFEFITIIAAIIFARAGVDLAVFEAGLGGRHDATSALRTAWHCFTPMAMDHEAVLGKSLAAIARDKAAAIRHGAKVYSAPQYPAALAQLRQACQARLAALTMARPVLLPPGMRLRGSFQEENAGLALACWRGIARDMDIPAKAAAERDGLARAFLPGRLQQAALTGGQILLLDSAHNPHAIQRLLASLPFTPDTVIFSALADKDWQNGLAMLPRHLPHARILLPQLRNERAADAWAMAAFARGHTNDAEMTPSVAAALNALKGGSALVCGSMYLLAEFYELHPLFLEDSISVKMDGL